MNRRPITDLTSWPDGALAATYRSSRDLAVRDTMMREILRRETPRPWLTGAEKIIFGINLFAVLALIAIAFWMSAP